MLYNSMNMLYIIKCYITCYITPCYITCYKKFWLCNMLPTKCILPVLGSCYITGYITKKGIM